LATTVAGIGSVSFSLIVAKVSNKYTNILHKKLKFLFQNRSKVLFIMKKLPEWKKRFICVVVTFQQNHIFMYDL